MLQIYVFIWFSTIKRKRQIRRRLYCLTSPYWQQTRNRLQRRLYLFVFLYRLILHVTYMTLTEVSKWLNEWVLLCAISAICPAISSSSPVDRGFKSIIDYQIGICCFSAKHQYSGERSTAGWLGIRIMCPEWDDNSIRANTLSWNSFTVLAHWNNSPRIELSSHSGHIILIPSQPAVDLSPEKPKIMLKYL
jgi:hypothetical protein